MILLYVLFLQQAIVSSQIFTIYDEEYTNLSIDVVENEQCRRDVKVFLANLTHHDSRAMKMFDASVKFPSALLSGNSYQFGGFDQCVTLPNAKYCLGLVGFNQTMFDDGQRYFTSRHQIKPPENTIAWGFCLPASCHHKDVEIIVEHIFKTVLNSESNVAIKIPARNCYVNSSNALKIGDIAYIIVIGVFLLLIMAATLYDLWFIYHSKASNPIIRAFSVIRNLQKVLKVKAHGNDLKLDCINGLRAICMFFILCGHALIFIISAPISNTQYYNSLSRFENAIFLNNPLLVDSFLLMGGLLMCRLLLLEYEKRNGRVNVLLVYVARYIRLTPAYLVVLGFYSTIFVRLNNGPMWMNIVGVEQERCALSWWKNVLYVNNYFNDNLCMFQSWYLSVDTQLFFVAPLIIYPLWKWRRFGESLLGVLIVLLAIIPFLLTYIYEYDPTFIVYPPNAADFVANSYFMDVYMKTHMRAHAYLVGILFGYLIHRIQAKGIKLPSWSIVVINLLALLVGLASLFSILVFYKHDHEYNALESAIYAPLHRAGWVFSIGWLILHCIINDGLINRFLSWKLWTPFAKLTYSAYLVNGIVELYTYGSLRHPKYLQDFQISIETGGHITTTLVWALIVCVLFESPIHNLEKLLLRKRSSNENVMVTHTRNNEFSIN